MLIILMLHAQFAIGHYFSGKWFVIPSIASIGIVMFFHIVFISAEISKLIRQEGKKK